MPPNRFGFGLIPDAPDTRDWLLGLALDVDASVPASASIGHLAHPILDQQGTQSCVGFAAAQALWIAQGSLGLAPVLPSPLAVYHDARRLRHGRGAVLQDVGCSPRHAWESLRTLGVVRYQDHPFAEGRVNMEVPWQARRRAIDYDWLAYYRIEATGDARCQQLRAAIAAGLPVSLGLTLDQGALDWSGPWPWRRTGPVIGRHMVTAVGYCADYVDAVGSWGPGYGLGGHHLIHWDAIRSAETTDLTVPQIDVERFKCIMRS